MELFYVKFPSYTLISIPDFYKIPLLTILTNFTIKICNALFNIVFIEVQFFLSTPSNFEAILFIIDYQRKQIMDNN